MNEDRLYYLLDSYKKGALSAEEQLELTKAIADASNAEVLKGWLADSWEKEELPDLLSGKQSQELYDTIKDYINATSENIDTTRENIDIARENLELSRENIKPARIDYGTKDINDSNRKQLRWHHLSRLSRIAAAASIVIAVSALSYLWLANHKQSRENELTKTIAQSRDIKAPDATRARITLADGSTLYLDSLEKGASASQQGAEIVKKDKGELQYKGTGTAKELTFNTLINPRGSDVVTITLSDGTRIWLNAESSITYPTSFIKGERKIELNGEAYLEVARNEKMPFIVNVRNRAEVKVLGTEFNIKAYDDEPEIRTTLVKGLVQVAKITGDNSTKTTQFFKLQPGQQASLDQNGLISVSEVDIKEFIAWKDNMFSFNDADLELIMKSLARWYDVEVTYENSNLKSLTFGALISRRSNISAILELMRMTGTVDFEILPGGKIVVKNGPKDNTKDSPEDKQIRTINKNI